jgi:hypothetical protein
LEATENSILKTDIEINSQGEEIVEGRDMGIGTESIMTTGEEQR